MKNIRLYSIWQKISYHQQIRLNIKIPLTSSIPVTTKNYRYPKVHELEVKTQITNMLNQGIIQPSTSPVWIVPKKMEASEQKKWRLVIDYRKLNDL